MNTKITSPSRQRIVWVAMFLAGLLLSGVAIRQSFRSASSMSAAAASSERSISQSASGEKVKVVVEISQSSPSGMLQGKLLEKQTEKVYARTSNDVTIHWSPETKFVMGQASDLHPKSVIHITGTVKDDRAVEAEQIVILTGYVEVR